MKKILLILLISFSLISYGKSINEDLLQLNFSDFLYHEGDKENPYTGEVVSFYKNGKIRNKMNYKDGMENGECIVYYENKQIRNKGNYKDGAQSGEWIFYYEDGKIKYKKNYDIDGGLNIYVRSIKKDLLQLNNSDFLYHEGDKENPYTGEVIYYYETGEIEQKRTYIDGIQNWEWIQYYKNGEIQAKNFYTDGKLKKKYGKRIGEKICYYETGEIQYKGNYEGGTRSGESFWYYKNGQIKSKLNYIDGIKNGEGIDYYENGKIKSKSNYIDGRLID